MHTNGKHLKFVPDILKQYLLDAENHLETEKLSKLLSKSTDQEKLNILQQSVMGSTALHKAASRDDAEVITAILSSLQPDDKIKLLLMKDSSGCTPLHKAADGNHKRSLKAILNTFTAKQQLQLLTEKASGDTAIEMSSGSTFDTLLEYGMTAATRARNGKIQFPDSNNLSSFLIKF